jgi:hypothetical protein
MLVKKIAPEIAVAAAALSHAAPSDTTTMVSISTWKRGAFAENVVEVYLDRVTGGPITVSGAYLVGYCAVSGKIRKLGDLNEGSDITLTDAIGYSERVVDVAGFSHLAVVDTGDTGTHVYGFIRLEHIGR